MSARTRSGHAPETFVRRQLRNGFATHEAVCTTHCEATAERIESAMLVPMTRDDIRAFAGRDWFAVEELKRESRARRAREGDCLAGFRAGQALYVHARRIRPDFPNDELRAADLADHVEMKRLLDQASRAIAGR